MEGGKHVYQIGGIKVEFPFKAYGPQLAYMGKIVTTLERAFRTPESHCNALLESPTGSGKSLALLCAALGWQQHRKTTTPAPQVGPATLVGGGFIPEETTQDTEDKKLPDRKNRPPTIFYTTRTHSQISQIIYELRRTSYRVPMAILAARKHYCTNRHVCKRMNIDEECKLLLKEPEKTCPQFKNVQKLKNHISLQKGGCHETHDIEDLVSIAHTVKGCAYFASRAMAIDANIVFCPYSYILNPIIRKAMDVDIRGAIIIFDEAHNIEDMAREAGSIDLETSVLEDLRVELEQLRSGDNNPDMYHPLLEMVQEMLIWIQHQEGNLKKREFEHYYTSWTGVKAIQELEAAGISLESFPILLDCALKATGAASDPDPEKSHLSGRAASALEGLFAALKFMLSKPERMHDYQLVAQKYMKKDEVMGVQVWVSSVSFWCLNPAVVFDEITTASKSVILTSGTLSPMGSFASELGTAFEISMEAPHVIDTNNQVFVGVLPVGPGRVPLNASYKHANTSIFQDALGLALQEICKVVPDGALIFFPSYKLLEKLCDRWKATGQWKRISDVKHIFVGNTAEPRGNTEKFEHVLKAYYNAITATSEGDHKKRGKKSRNKAIVKNLNAAPLARQNGAAFLAVCRGKVSEGINFSDENARIVVLVGIPFPNVKDIQVSLKKQYNDDQRTSKHLLGGDQWYCHQAFRALNQAVGRCIRHRNDYGAIVLLDERFSNSTNLTYMSKWLRKSIRKPGNFEEIIEDLQGFFSKFKGRSCPGKDIAKVPKSISTSTSCAIPNPAARDGSNMSYKNWSEVQLMESENPINPQTVSELSTFEHVSMIPQRVSQLSVFENVSMIPQKVSQLYHEVPSTACHSFHQLTTETPAFDIQEGAVIDIGTPACLGSVDYASNGGQTATQNERIEQATGITEAVSESLSSAQTPISIKQKKNFAPTEMTADELADDEFFHQEHSFAKDADAESEVTSDKKDYLLFCCKCGHHLGVSEQSYVRCQLGELQKTYLTSLVNNSHRETSSVAVLIIELSLLHSFLFDNPHGKAFHQTSFMSAGVWIEEDGCVFKPIICSWCSDSNVCLGAHIVATDLANMELAGKVVLLLDFVKAIQEPEKQNADSTARTQTPCSLNTRSISRIENCCDVTPSTVNSKRPSVAPAAKGKLKLRKKDVQKSAL